MTRKGLSYPEALASIISRIAPLDDETVPLTASIGRALATAVSSDVDVPPWDNSGMDGYAVRRADVLGASPGRPATLRVTGTIAAGSAVGDRIGVGECMRIMTGAPVPPGADCVVRVEDTDGGTSHVRIASDRDAQGRGNIRPRGEDARVGELLFGPGTTLSAAHLGVLASTGHANVRVHRRPRVAIVSSGDELVTLEQFDAVQRGERIVSSNSYALPAWLEQAGAHVDVLPIASDSIDALTTTLTAALDRGCDLLITTGGVSVGAHDFTRDALEAIGGTLDFWRARIRPGGPIGTGTVRDVPWLGLPGNPVSSMVTGFLFAWPVVRRLGGHNRFNHRSIRVRMLDDVSLPAPLTHFLRVTLQQGTDGMLEAHLAGAQGSNLMRVMAAADALLVIPEAVDEVEKGAMFHAMLFPHALTTDT